MDMPQWPPLSAGVERTVYVHGAPTREAEILRGRGYSVVEVNTLPRNSEQEHLRYLLAKAQGVEEGTIEVDQEGRKVLELEMRAYGLLDKRTTSLNLQVHTTSEEVSQIFGWGHSRHTLVDNSTQQGAARLKISEAKGD